LRVLPDIRQSLSQDLPYDRKTNLESHEEHEEKKNLCVLGALRGSNIWHWQEGLCFHPIANFTAATYAHLN
jgi:hypothetical protein